VKPESLLTPGPPGSVGRDSSTGNLCFESASVALRPRKNDLCLALSIFLGGCVCVPPVEDSIEQPTPPNLVLIVWDTVRADRLGFYGYEKPTTDHMNQWAEGAVVYENAVSPAVWTLPAHGSIFTGLPVSAHGVNADHKWLDKRFTTLAEALSAAGYDTYGFSANPYMQRKTNLAQGFDVFEHPWSPRWEAEARKSLQQKLIAEDASSSVSPGWPGLNKAEKGTKYSLKEGAPVARLAVAEWLDSRPDKSRPYFIFLNYMETHLPRVPSMNARQKVADKEVIEHSFQVVQSSPRLHGWMVGLEDYSDRDIEAISAVYDACIVDIDLETSRLISDLKGRNELDNTITVLTSDHGENLGDHGLMLHKYGVHRSLSRVPLVVSYPGVLAPARKPEATSTGELFSILVDLGLPAGTPKELTEHNKKKPSFSGVYTEFVAISDGSLEKTVEDYPQANVSPFYRTFWGVELNGWKLHVGSDGSEQLFDLAIDPGETNSLASKEAEKLVSMKADHRAWLTTFDAYDVDETETPEVLDAETRAGLEALGYVEEEVTKP
jgi:arylsulfatase A-like enzyme